MEAKQVAPFVVLLVVNVPLFMLLGKAVFGGWAGFIEALVFWVKPELWSAIQGEFWEDWWAEIKLGFFAVACVTIYLGECYVVIQVLPGVFDVPFLYDHIDHIDIMPRENVMPQ